MTTKHQVREHTNYAVKLLLLGHSTQAVVAKVAEREGCSRRTARRITARAWKVVRDDVDKVGLENPEMASLLIHQLQTIAAQGLETNPWVSCSRYPRVGCTVGNRREQPQAEGWLLRALIICSIRAFS